MIAGRNPLLDPTSRIVIAHRGNRAGAPENTMESLRQAVTLGADALEFDVRATRDGVPVVMHDPDIDRTTDGSGPVASYTFEALRTFDAGARSPRRGGAMHRIPSLEEVLETFRDIPLVIEVKELAAAESAERMLRRFGAEGRALVGSGDSRVMERLYASGLACCASMRDAVRLIPRALLGILPRAPRYRVLSVTPRYRGLPIPVRRMAAVARQAGVATQVWTINDPQRALALWRGGVSGIVTDDPAAMIRVRPR